MKRKRNKFYWPRVSRRVTVRDPLLSTLKTFQLKVRRRETPVLTYKEALTK